MTGPIRNRVLDSYPVSTDEWVPFDNLRIDTESPNPITVDYALRSEHAVGPITAWTPAVVLDGVPGFTVNGSVTGRGIFAVYVRVTGTGEKPVRCLGYIRID